MKVYPNDNKKVIESLPQWQYHAHITNPCNQYILMYCYTPKSSVWTISCKIFLIQFESTLCLKQKYKNMYLLKCLLKFFSFFFRILQWRVLTCFSNFCLMKSWSWWTWTGKVQEQMNTAADFIWCPDLPDFCLVMKIL